MNIDSNLVENVVKQILASIDERANIKYDDDENLGVFSTMESAIAAAKKASREMLSCSMSDRARYIEAIRATILEKENLEYISKAAFEETGMGNYLDKIQKNKLAVTKTPGIEDLTTIAMTGDDGLTLVEYSPFGVIGAITPTTNPTETIICNGIGMIASGNSVVFSPHPRAKNVSLHLIRLINKALEIQGAPKNLIVTVKEPTLDSTNIMISHPDVKMLVATGGPGIVELVLSSGKKSIGAGAGNPPVVVDETADIEKAAKCIVSGASFDNNLPCIAEKEIIAVDSIADFLLFNMKKEGSYVITDQSILHKLMATVLNDKGGPKTNFIGKSAKYIMNQIGINVGEDIKLIVVETDESHPFVQEELMMPIIPLIRVNDVDTAIEMAIRVEHGFRHTAIMHSKDIDKLTKMAKLIQTTIFVKNGPSYSGIGFGGEGYTTFTIAGPTGEGLTSPKSFARIRRCVLSGSLDIR